MKAVISLCLLFLGAPSFATPSCPNGGISKLDVKNLEIPSPNAGGEALKFKNGIAESKIDRQQSQAEWEYSITGDELIKPARSVQLRVLQMSKNHLQGSGGTTLFTVLGCQNGNLNFAWPLTEINSLTIRQGKIHYESLGEYQGANPRGKGKVSVLEWDPKKRVLNSKSGN